MAALRRGRFHFRQNPKGYPLKTERAYSIERRRGSKLWEFWPKSPQPLDGFWIVAPFWKGPLFTYHILKNEQPRTSEDGSPNRNVTKILDFIL